MREALKAGLQRRGWISKRILLALLFIAALNIAAFWWLRASFQPRSPTLRVVSALLTSGEDGPPTVRVLFSRDVVPADPIKQPDPRAWMRISPEVAGTVRWSTPRELVFDPASSLSFSQDFLVIITPPVRPGAPLFEGPLRLGLRTPALRLLNALQLSLSAESRTLERSVTDTQATLRLVFNGPVDARHLVSHLRVVPGSDESRKEKALTYQVLSERPSKEVDIRLETEAARLVVGLGPALEGYQDFLHLEAEQSVEVELTRVLRLTVARGSRATLDAPTLELYFNNAIVRDDNRPMEQSIGVEPEVPFTVLADGSRVTLLGAFEPGGHYEVTVKKGFKGAAGSVLADDVRRDVYFPDREPQLRFGGRGTFLSRQGKLSIVIQCVNVRTVSVEASRVSSNSLVPALESGWSRGQFVRKLPPRTYHVPSDANQVRDVTIDLQEIVGDDPRGVWWIVASSGPGETERASPISQIVGVSDIGISFKEGAKNNVVVWVVSLRSGDPLSGVTVGLRSLANQLIAESVTGADGLAFFDDLPQDEDSPCLVVATRDQDLAYLEVAKRRLSRAEFDVGGRPFLHSGFEAFLFTDRGVYRPGETVHVRCLVRGAGGSVPAPFPLEIETLRPDEKRYRLEKVQFGPEGAVETMIPITPSAHTGLYKVEVRLRGGADGPRRILGSQTFRVEEYRPSHLRVEVTIEERSIAVPGENPHRRKPGEVVDIHVRGSHLFGLPAAACSVDVSWSFAPVSFSPRQWRGFQFGELNGRSGRVRVEARSLVLDASGEAIVKVEVPRVESTMPLALQFTARVTDLGDRSVEGAVTVPIDPAPHYLGLRAITAPGEEGIQGGKAARFECVALKPDGSPAAIEAADLLVQAYEWATVLKRDANGEYHHESREEIREVARQRIVFSSGRGAFEHTFPEWGAYRLRLKDPASLAVAELCVLAGGPRAGFTATSLERPERLDISFDRSGYQPGESARIRVKAPFAGTLLLTLEGDKVYWAQVVKTESSFAEVEVPLPADVSAAFHVGASVVRGMDPNARWLPHRAFGIERIPLDLSSRRLTVTISAPSEARSGGPLVLRTTVVREDGEPVPGAEVKLALVDEGALSLTQEELPDPHGFFYGRRAHTVETSDTFGALDDEVPFTREGERLADGLSSWGSHLNPVSVQRVTPEVIWHGPLTTGEDGSVLAQLTLPQFTGDLRITAVVSAKSLFGSSRRRLVVRRPFFFETSFPRFLAPGDLFQAPLSLFNRTATSGVASIAWSLENFLEGVEPSSPDLTFAVLRDSKLEVPAWGGARASYRLRVGDGIGKASAKICARLQDASCTETIELPVRPAAPLVSESQSGEVTAAASFEIAPSRRLHEGSSCWRLVLSDFPDLDLAEPLKYLLDSPYGGLEPTISSAFALLYLRDLAEKAGLVGCAGSMDGMRHPGAVQSFVEGSIARILDMQSQGGWMGMYPRVSSPAPWCTVYATHFLLEAKGMGYAVPEGELEAALRYIEEAIVAAPGSTAPERILRACYGAYVLSLAQKPNRRAMARLRDLALGVVPTAVEANGKGIHFQFPPSARAFLSVAYLVAGDRAEAVALRSGPLPLAAPETESGETFRSPAREDAVLLWALLEVDPIDPRIPELLDRLKRYRVDGRWATTQENAFALLALGKLARCKSVSPQWYKAEVTIAAHPPVQLGPGESRIFQGSELEGAIKIVVSGPGRINYWYREEGLPHAGDVSEVDSGLVVRRALLRRNLKPLDSLTLRVGEEIVVQWTIEARDPVENVVIVDLLPAGFEVENLVPGGLSLDLRRDGLLAAESVSLGDDRVIAFFNLSSRKRGEFYYAARAVTRGEFCLPPLSAHALYRPGTRSVSGSGKVVIR